ncbi:pyridoxine metabolism protein [Phakopsora pachyrhizi]|uniref:glutaminase n=1 Tax=Phakopsora pachyrhizi TaxID=170000 RepID=A0AAV0BTV6_PHAPC|nr:pyridoxine metabolism protein [Phakopsora pachyrhizi]
MKERLPILPPLRQDEGSRRVVIGVLALQGAFLEHLNHLIKTSSSIQVTANVSIDSILVKTSSDLIQCSGLIIPGGESTTMNLLASNQIDSRLIEPNIQKFSLMDWLKSFVRSGRAIFGTCAGLILLSDEVYSVDRKSRLNNEKKGDLAQRSSSLYSDPVGLGGLPIKTIRNQYGNQLNSFEHQILIPCLSNPEIPFPAVFIRAPMIHTIKRPSKTIKIDSFNQHEEDKDLIVKILVKLPSNETMTEDYNPGRATDQPYQPNQNSYLEDASLGPDHEIVGLSFRNILATSFHPELTPDYRFHLYWISNFVL